MDSSTTQHLKPNRLLYTTGLGEFQELSHWQVPELQSTDILVKSVMTGICRSDISMMRGEFGPLPLHMQGHEGLGEVIAVGSAVTDVVVGDAVATRGEPAFADYYPAKYQEYVKVPTLHPRYIIEPVACGINIVTQNLEAVMRKSGSGKRLLLLGSGFLTWVAYHTIKNYHLNFEIDVVGSWNQELWRSKLKSHPEGTYDVIIDLSSKTNVFDLPIFKAETLMILGSQKTVTTDLSQLLWNACTVICPSPRNAKFYETMKLAVDWIATQKLQVDAFWTHSYNRNLQWRLAFQEGFNRAAGYNRGYICW